MDDLDARIIRELTWKPADPIHFARGLRRPWDTARSAGIHGTTVKRRLAEMRGNGMLRGVHLQPAGQIVGRMIGQHMMTWADPAAKHAGIQRLIAHPEVWQVYSFVGPEALAIIATPRDEDDVAAAREIAASAGAGSVELRERFDWDVPVDRITSLDLRILAALVDDALRPITEVAHEVGVTRKTVSTRLKALARMRAFSVIPDVPQAEDGMLVLFDLEIDPRSSADTHARLMNSFPEAVCRSIRAESTAYVVEPASSAAEVEDKLMQAQSVPGVRAARTLLCRDSWASPARYREALLARAHDVYARRLALAYHKGEIHA